MTDFDDRFEVGNTVYAVLPNNSSLELKIDQHRVHKGFDILHFSGYDNINDVEHLKGSLLKIKASQLTELEEGEYYFHDIIGCTVWTTDGQELGTIKEILSPGANDVWVIKPEKGKDILIPYIGDVVKDVDVANKRIEIELMEGLLD
ncbi:ribosome maturation factor RimM [Lentibacillus sp. JNUCC-1]|uniref:ribosome maturation factor RimM n=1 Tax=Lentibacillus sp. JNUCC-1 TaxID=2654513 RepID=UPI002F91AA22